MRVPAVQVLEGQTAEEGSGGVGQRQAGVWMGEIFFLLLILRKDLGNPGTTLRAKLQVHQSVIGTLSYCFELRIARSARSRDSS